ncbi:hypothetical protein A2335_03255 [Candidatus Peregrinibacteria bacterium RIFOXYB2_FULL_32_7]|nr:MAG: hypothetical protein A2335_03255 [Candidatus Peregrinibacteria bacterium RIFOXYB2_FULL_32_7]
MNINLTPKFLAKTKELEIDFNDIEEKFTHGSGHGGQKINKTENTVFLKDLKTGITVKIQKYREREKNRLFAYKLLINKIEDLKKGKESEKAQKNFKIRKQKQRRSRKAKEKMLEEKRKRSELKKMRRGKE